jgi:hypothetical protein
MLTFPLAIWEHLMSQHLNYIAGEWVEGRGTITNITPSDLSDIVGHYASADEAATGGAVAAAKAAFPHWAAATPQTRADFLDAIGSEILARKEEIGRVLSRGESPCPMALPRWQERARSLSFSPAKPCASRVRRWHPFAPAWT